MATNIKKNAKGYGYTYTDLAQIHNYLEENGMSYYQYTETDEKGTDYIYTVPIIGGEEKKPRRGCRVIQASLSGKSNPAQEQGSGLTYARRYSLLMAFGLATTDDDAQIFDRPATSTQKKPAKPAEVQKISQTDVNVIRDTAKAKGFSEKAICKKYGIAGYAEMTFDQWNDAMKILDGKPDVKQEEQKAPASNVLTAEQVAFVRERMQALNIPEQTVLEKVPAKERPQTIDGIPARFYKNFVAWFEAKEKSV